MNIHKVLEEVPRDTSTSKKWMSEWLTSSSVPPTYVETRNLGSGGLVFKVDISSLALLALHDKHNTCNKTKESKG